ncbi:MAG: type II secretion system F family protein, partial [Actinobacteria bacterium]|nr:type II secretion system F family protein [Actinomycetota bacterium]
MTQFKYHATDPDGRKVSGRIDASSARTASSMLFERNLQPTRIKERRSIAQFEIVPGRVSKLELMYFSRQLAAFIRAGVPIQESLETLYESSDNPTMRRVITELTDSLSAGDNLATAIGAHPRVFPNFYRSIMRSAELTGALDRVLDQLSAYLERDVEAGRRIRQALTYPIVIMLLSIATVIILSAFVLPRFETLLNSVQTDPPLATRILLVSSRFMGNWWWLITAILLGGFLLVASAVRTSGGRSIGDRVLLHIPVLGDTVRMAVIERFCRILAAMVDAGVPLPDAMVVAAEASANTVYERAINQV